MKLLRDSLLLRVLRRLLAGRRTVARHAYAVTVPAPLAKPAGHNVIELHRRTPVADSRAPAPAKADVSSSVHLPLASSR